MVMYHEAYDWKDDKEGTSQQVVEETNSFLRLVLQLCPALRYFNLQGDIGRLVSAVGTCLNVSFVVHLHIRSISLHQALSLLQRE